MSRILNFGKARSLPFPTAILSVTLLLGTALAGAQTPSPEPAAPAKPPAPETYSGCVQKAPGSTTDLIISAPTACARLTGKLPDPNLPSQDLAGHEVELKGVLTPRTPSTAASIEVGSVVSVGKSCTDVCSLQPHTRGLHPPSATPGGEGGTPGLAPTQPPK